MTTKYTPVSKEGEHPLFTDYQGEAILYNSYYDAKREAERDGFSEGEFEVKTLAFDV